MGTCAQNFTHRLNIKPGVPQREESLCRQNTCVLLTLLHLSVWLTADLMGKKHSMRSNTGSLFKLLLLNFVFQLSYMGCLIHVVLIHVVFLYFYEFPFFSVYFSCLCHLCILLSCIQQQPLSISLNISFK